MYAGIILRFLLLVASCLLLLILLPLTKVDIVWDGGFLTGEYEIRFVYKDGDPIEGVQLTMEDDEHNAALCYPFNDLVSSSGAISDTNGRVVLHHVSEGPEFSGRCHRILFIVPLPSGRRCGGPGYTCICSHNHREVYRVAYDQLNDELREKWEEADKITMDWKWPSGCPEKVSGGRIRIKWEGEPRKVTFRVLRKTIVVTLPK
jgi:hypothetical protein